MRQWLLSACQNANQHDPNNFYINILLLTYKHFLLYFIEKRKKQKMKKKMKEIMKHWNKSNYNNKWNQLKRIEKNRNNYHDKWDPEQNDINKMHSRTVSFNCCQYHIHTHTTNTPKTHESKSFLVLITFENDIFKIWKKEQKFNENEDRISSQKLKTHTNWLKKRKYQIRV